MAQCHGWRSRAAALIRQFVAKVLADGAYPGQRVASATRIAIEIIPAKPGQVGFAVQPRRLVVEHSCAWICRDRRLTMDFEATIASVTAFLYAAWVTLPPPWASITLNTIVPAIRMILLTKISEKK